MVTVFLLQKYHIDNKQLRLVFILIHVINGTAY